MLAHAPEQYPLDIIAELANRNASGELICASESVEVHIYFQRGRVAWATDSARPLAFTRALLESAQIDVNIFREILESCRREKRPLGETLVAWGVASREEVREALRHQVDLAVTLLAESGTMQTLFLNRPQQFANYDPDLTFALEEIVARRNSEFPPPTRPSSNIRALPALPPVPPGVTGVTVNGPSGPQRTASASNLRPVRPSTTLRAVQVPAQPVRPRTVSLGTASAQERLRTTVDGIAWVEVLDGAELVESNPAADASRVPRSVVEKTLLDGAGLVAVRVGDSTLAGVIVDGESQSLWCRVEDDATLGAIVATLATLGDERARSVRGESYPGDGALWAFGDESSALWRPLRDFVERAPEIHAAFVAEAGVTRDRFVGVGRVPTSPDKLASLVERRGVLASSVVAPLLPNKPDAYAGSDVEGLSSRRIMTAEQSFYLFAAELVVQGTSRLVWLVIDPTCSKGLGWGYLTSISRQLVRALRGDVG